jgi:hypothetical protein
VFPEQRIEVSVFTGSHIRQAIRNPVVKDNLTMRATHFRYLISAVSRRTGLLLCWISLMYNHDKLNRHAQPCMQYAVQNDSWLVTSGFGSEFKRSA